MHGTYKPNTISPSGNYEIIYGETHEYGMGGPYASSIYLKQKDKAPFFIENMCYGDLRFADDESCFYFLHLNSDRKIQVMQFLFDTNELKLFYDEFAIAEFETTSTKFGYSVNGKNWIAAENKYNEGLIICDTNDENVQSKKIIEPVIRILPTHGIEIITFFMDRKMVNARLGAPELPNQQIDYYTNHGYHIHYNEKDVVTFIEIMGDMQSKFELYDQNPFTANTDELVKLLTEKNIGEINGIEAPADYIFVELGLGVFRSSTPEQYQAYIEEAKKDEPENFVNGIPEEMLEDLEKTKHFQTIALGDKDYFRDPIYFTKE